MFFVIDFGCSKVSLEDIIRCGFGLNKTEYGVLMLLTHEEKPIKVTQIANYLNKERTTVQKVIKSLVKKELIKRGQVNLKRGGYVFVYSSIDKDLLKEKTREMVERWVRNAEKEINEW